jgi:hypothetical protein
VYDQDLLSDDDLLASVELPVSDLALLPPAVRLSGYPLEYPLEYPL